jgi:hypothetical protein
LARHLKTRQAKSDGLATSAIAASNSISRRAKTTHKASAHRVFPLKIAHSACEASQNSRKSAAYRLSSAQSCPAYRNSTVYKLNALCSEFNPIGQQGGGSAPSTSSSMILASSTSTPATAPSCVLPAATLPACSDVLKGRQTPLSCALRCCRCKI